LHANFDQVGGGRGAPGTGIAAAGRIELAGRTHYWALPAELERTFQTLGAGCLSRAPKQQHVGVSFRMKSTINTRVEHIKQKGSFSAALQEMIANRNPLAACRT